MTFDASAMVWYGAICGALAALAPVLRTPLRRIVLGALVGIVAASLFPLARTVFGL
ncbi:MAG: hypothetical protein AAGH60_14920 [Pseudomonadota bacterium]